MAENLERLKQRIPLLEYLQRHNWKPCRAGVRQEFVGLCPLHQETRPSFYVNAAKNLFYCHGCGRGGDGCWGATEQKTGLRNSSACNSLNSQQPTPGVGTGKVTPKR